MQLKSKSFVTKLLGGGARRTGNENVRAFTRRNVRFRASINREILADVEAGDPVVAVDLAEALASLLVDDGGGTSALVAERDVCSRLTPGRDIATILSILVELKYSRDSRPTEKQREPTAALQLKNWPGAASYTNSVCRLRGPSSGSIYRNEWRAGVNITQGPKTQDPPFFRKEIETYFIHKN